ncbi:MAG: DUF1353 domain-containing protein [Gammaproteobacteria bacterium]|nr:DUF1353 domain-containing protein [Gammaproteobacteria bacterium]
MTNHGYFSGNPKTEWLVDANGNDRDMQVIENFWFIDPEEKTWPAPAGSIINGASIPRPLWPLVGSPYTDDYRRASIVHDVACDDPKVDRKDADKMFFHACRAGGCSPLQARWLYAGVRIGAWANASLPKASLTKETLLFRVPFKTSSEEQLLQEKFHAIAFELTGLPDELPIEAIDAIINKHFKL